MRLADIQTEQALPGSADNDERAVGQTIRRTQRGVVLVEFAIIFPILMLVLGVAIDLGLLFWDSSLLTHAVSRSARRAALAPHSHTCSELTFSACEYVSDNFAGFGFASDWATVAVSVEASPYPSAPNHCALLLEARRIPNCLFCFALPSSFAVETSSSVVIENSQFCLTNLSCGREEC